MHAASDASLGPALPETRRWWTRNQKRLAPFVFISPFYILFFVFFLGPSIFAFYLAFHEWTGLGAPKFVGLRNFLDLVEDRTFRQAVVNSAFYSGASLFVITPLSLLLAVALNSRFVRAKIVFRTIFFLPILTSTIAIALVFVLLYGTRYGLLNAPLVALDLGPIDWLGSKVWSKIAVTGLILWRWVGFNMIYFLAGLQAIPQHLYEAAKVDGANQWQSFRFITVPMLRPVILFVAVIVLIGSAQIFDEPYILTEGGPAESSTSLAMYLYRVGLHFLSFGYASAIGAVFFIAIFAFSWMQLRILGVFSDD